MNTENSKTNKLHKLALINMLLFETFLHFEKCIITFGKI